MNVKTRDLLRGDRITFADQVDEVLTVEFPDEPAVVAKVLVKRRFPARDTEPVYTFFFAGADAEHEVTR